MTASQYTIVKLDLTVAGKETVDGPWSICRFLDAVDGAGDVATTAKITVKAERGAEAAPLRLGQGFLARNTKRWIVEWLPQSGVVIELGFGERPENLDWDADPPAKLLTGSVGLTKAATLTSAADVALTAATVTEIKAAASTRREIIITNLKANAAVVRVGDGSVSATRGIPLQPGESITLDVTVAVSGFSTPGESVAVLEVLD